MIRVIATHDGTGQVLAEMRIEWLSQVDEDLHRYSLQVAVGDPDTVRLHQRNFLFNRTQGNTLALIQTAISTLDESSLRLPDGTSSSDLARRFRRAGTEIPAKEDDPERHHRPPFWSR